MFIYKDYQFNNGILFKNGIIDSKHLLWKYGGVPAIDSYLWDTYKNKIDKIVIKTRKGRRFEISKRAFETYKKMIGFGKAGFQYYVEKHFWQITGFNNRAQIAEVTNQNKLF